MSHPEIDYRVALERRQDELAEAENSRLVKIALEGQYSRSPSWLAMLVQFIGNLVGRGMYWLGERIEGWGCRLQVRYATGNSRGQPAPCD